MAIQEPFYFKMDGFIYEVVPEEDEVYTIFKDGAEYIQVHRHKSSKWLRLDYKTDLPIIEENAEVDAIGRLILGYLKT